MKGFLIANLRGGKDARRVSPPLRTALGLALILLLIVFLRQEGIEDQNLAKPTAAPVVEVEEDLEPMGEFLRKSLPVRSSTVDLKPSTRRLIAALDRGEPARLTVDGEMPLTLLLQPKKAVADNFRVSLGAGSGAADGEFEPQVLRVYGGRVLTNGGKLGGSAVVSVVDDAVAAVIVEEDGDVLNVKTDSETGELLTLREAGDEPLGTCEHDVDAGIASVVAERPEATEEDWLAGPRAQIAAAATTVANAGGVNPGTGRLDKYLEPLPLGRNYDLSLRDMLVLVVLDKDATGANTTSRFTTVTSEYLARMASVAGVHEHNLGVRLLVQELILTPDADEFDDVPASLGNFRSWIGSNRARGTYLWNAAAKFGDTATDGGVIGVAYVRALSGGNGVSVNRKGYGPALVAHEMGHNMGSSHSSGGIMNSGLIGSARTFFNDVTTGETAAKDIYDHTRTRIYGPATMRHPEEIPFANDDDRTTDVDEPHVFNPVANDANIVRNGTANSVVTLEEVSRVQPLDAGTVEISGDNEVTFTPAAGWEGLAFFSYSIRGDVGNGGEGWLHKGDAAVEVGSFDRNSLDLTLAPGQVFSFRPSGTSNPSINSQPDHAFAGTSRDDRKLIIIRVEETAVGSDSFTFSRDGSTSTVNITYLDTDDYLTAANDVFFFDGSESSIDFHPLVNDQGGGYLSPATIRPTVNAARPLTFYFRKSFTATGVGGVTGLDIELLRDDGAVVYLNSTEILRDNMPAGAVDFETLAPASVGGADETTYFDFAGLAPAALVEGQNVIAVELHQNSATSSDTAFDLSLTTAGGTVLIPRESEWRYLDDSSDQGTAWSGAGFNDNSWSRGDAPFGFGDNRETTRLASGFYTVDVLPGAFRIVSATNLDPSKGSLDFSDTRPFTIDGSRTNLLTGLMSFTPAPGATGIGSIEYTIEDGVGNQTTGLATIVLPLVEITEPDAESVIVDVRNGILLDGVTHDGAGPPLSGSVTPSWSVVSAPDGGEVLFDDSAAVATAARFTRAGDYVIRLTGTDNGFSTSQERHVRVVDPREEGSLSNGLVGWWKLDETGGATVADASGNGHNGARSGSGFSTGLIDGAFEFNATTGRFVNLDSHVDSFENLAQGSIACWFQTNTGSERVLFAAADGGDSSSDLRLYIDDGKLKYKVRGDIGTSESSLASPDNVNDNQWHHAAITVDAAMNATLYLDGEAVTTGSRPFFTAVFDLDRLRIGQTYNSGAPADPYRGKVDDLRVYQRLLDPEEIAELASASRNRAPLVTLPDTQPRTGGANFDLGLLSPKSVDDGVVQEVTWTQVDGPFGVNFTSPGLLASQVSFPAPGLYTLQLAADDGEVTAFDRVVIEYTGEGAAAPISLGIPDVVVPQNAPDTIIDLFAVFEDAQDADSALTFEVTAPNGLSFGSPLIIGAAPKLLVLDYAAMGGGTTALVVRATDTDGNATEATFNVTVENFQPRIVPQYFSIAEESDDGALVGTLAASDPDGDEVRFALLSGNTGGIFTVDPTTGVIRLADRGLLDFESAAGYTLVVAVTDPEHLSYDSTAVVSIDVRNVNEAPQIDSAYITAPEGTPAGTVIGTIGATDPDGRPVTFQIVGGNAAGVFDLDEDDGFLTLENPAAFNAAANPQFVLSVRVTDDGSPPLSDTAEIRINPAPVLIAEGAAARWRVPTSSADDATWAGRTFVDSAWASGSTGIGYDTADDYDSLIATDVQAEMEDINASIYIRIPFNVADPSALGSLTLDMKYDDGFVAYLNGAEVAERNAPGSPDWDSDATANHADDDAQEFESIDISDGLDQLVAGTNVLAIHGLNNGADSSDLLMLPRLTATAALPVPAGVSLSVASPVGTDSATLRGSVDSTGGDTPDISFVWGRSAGGEDVASWEQSAALGLRGAGNQSAAIAGLLPGRTYFFNIIATNVGGTSTAGAPGTFTTLIGDPIVLVPEGASARGLVPTNASPIDATWRERGFDDGAWESGVLAAGYDTGNGYAGLIGGSLDFETEMFETNTTLYLRVPFVPANASALDRLTLRMKYDDGFVAYLNGIEVARRNAFGGVPIWNSGASAGHPDGEATVFEDIDISGFAGVIAPGANVLAIHGLNDGAASSDMLISPELLGYQLDGVITPIDLYNTWATAENGLSGADALSSADPDGDGVSNLLEYAFVTDPGAASSQTSPAELGEDAGVFTMNYRRRTDAAARGLRYTVEAGLDLEGWFPAAFDTPETVQALPGGEAELVTVRIATPGDGAYFRVAVELE